MEQRTFLAILLSLLVLFTYNLIVSNEARRRQQKEKYLQPIDNNDVRTTKSSEPTPIKQPEQSEEVISTDPEITQLFENNIFTGVFSNIGGTLKSITIQKYDQKLPVTDIFLLSEYDKVPFNLVERIGERISYSYQDSRYRILKRYLFPNNSNVIWLEIEIENISDAPLIPSPIVYFTLDTEESDKDPNLSYEKNLFEYSVATSNGIYRKGNAVRFHQKENRHKDELLNWLGFRDRYFCVLVKPEFVPSGYSVSAVDEYHLRLAVFQDVSLGPGRKAKHSFSMYVGPQDIPLLKSYGKGFEDIVTFSNWILMDFISKAILTTMRWIHRVIPNWGLCIILMSILIYIAMYPLTLKGMSSMKKMQTLQPKIAKLREQYKSQPQKLNKEIMELYKEHKINPFGGCLPFILQMPVFIGLYQALWRSIIFKGANFLWIKDLSQPDRLFIFPFKLPIFGNELNILPLAMVFVMYYQQKLSSKNIVVLDPSQATQQKFMTIFFPIFLGILFYKFASGLTLYFTVFYILSTITQLKMSKVVAVKP